MNCRANLLFLLAVLVLPLAACSPKIYGALQLVDADMIPIPVATESPEGTIVNMINTTASLEKASHSVSADKMGNFQSGKRALSKGTYKVEASRIGYATVTQTVQLGYFTKQELKLRLKKIHEGRRKSIGSAKSDEDKIINPGEVNIRPPSM
ncbi:MAG: hypothetical protein HWN68_12590 [Desulfobacterales bacterium]|nr:hypothetical protein [Desulfobacterales bacterium]